MLEVVEPPADQAHLQPAAGQRGDIGSAHGLVRLDQVEEPGVHLQQDLLERFPGGRVRRAGQRLLLQQARAPDPVQAEGALLVAQVAVGVQVPAPVDIDQLEGGDLPLGELAAQGREIGQPQPAPVRERLDQQREDALGITLGEDGPHVEADARDGRLEPFRVAPADFEELVPEGPDPAQELLHVELLRELQEHQQDQDLAVVEPDGRQEVRGIDLVASVRALMHRDRDPDLAQGGHVPVDGPGRDLHVAGQLGRGHLPPLLEGHDDPVQALRLLHRGGFIAQTGLPGAGGPGRRRGP